MESGTAMTCSMSTKVCWAALPRLRGGRVYLLVHANVPSTYSHLGIADIVRAPQFIDVALSNSREFLHETWRHVEFLGVLEDLGFDLHLFLQARLPVWQRPPPPLLPLEDMQILEGVSQ